VRIKKAINNFLQSIYVLLSSLIAIGAILLIIFIVIVVAANVNYNQITLIFFGGAVFLALFYLLKNRKKIFKTNTNKNSSGFLLFEILRLVVSSIFFFIIILNLGSKFHKNTIAVKDETEEVILYIDSTETKVDKYYLSHQKWRDFNRKKHKLPFRIDYNNVVKSNANKDKLKVSYKGDHIVFWNKFYKGIINHDKPLIEDLAQTFFEYQKEKKMNRKDFAELIISAIQDIPYVLVSNEDCEQEEFRPCVGNIRMGLFAPAEFISNLKGDCDTRTILLYSLLSRFNYDVVILNSIQYEHSILGLQIPSSGKFKLHKRKKYYFVETTSKRNPIGYLPRDYSNIAYWDVVMTTN